MAKGQASAIGAVFLVIIIALSLSYVVWAIAQIRELNEGLVKAISVREESRKERIEVTEYNYVEYSDIPYTSMDGSLTSSCIELGGETSASTQDILNDSFTDPPWSNGWTSSIYADTNFHIEEYWGSLPSIDGRSIGFEAWAVWPGWITKNAEGNWSKTFTYTPGGETSISLELDYRVETWYISSIFPFREAKASWTIQVVLVTPSGAEYIVANATLPTQKYIGDSFSGHFSVSLSSYMTEAGSYKIKLRSMIHFSGSSYDGYALFDNLKIYKGVSSTTGGLSICKASATFTIDMPEKPLSTDIIVSGVLNESADLYVMYYDSLSSTWREIGHLIPEASQTFTITLDVDSERLYSEGRGLIRLVMEGNKPFELTLNTLSVRCGFLSDELNVTVMNTYSLPVKITSIWVINSTHVWRFGVTSLLLPGETETFEIPVRMSLNSAYTVRVVTEKGNIFDTTIRT